MRSRGKNYTYSIISLLGLCRLTFAIALGINLPHWGIHQRGIGEREIFWSKTWVLVVGFYSQASNSLPAIMLEKYSALNVFLFVK